MHAAAAAGPLLRLEARTLEVSVRTPVATRGLDEQCVMTFWSVLVWCISQQSWNTQLHVLFAALERLRAGMTGDCVPA